MFASGGDEVYVTEEHAEERKVKLEMNFCTWGCPPVRSLLLAYLFMVLVSWVSIIESLP